MTEPARLRALLAEAAELRGRRDLGAAHAVEMAALVSLRSIIAAARPQQPKRRVSRRRACA